jgi:arsenate reductase (glutaredoxin)
MSLRVYAYEKCDSCRKALKFLRDRKIAFDLLPIREQPPKHTELRAVLSHVGQLRRLFNTSGQDYRALGIGEKLSSMKEDEALGLLARNGNLVKRPFVIGDDWGTAGFNEEEWGRRFK